MEQKQDINVNKQRIYSSDWSKLLNNLTTKKWGILSSFHFQNISFLANKPPKSAFWCPFPAFSLLFTRMERWGLNTYLYGPKDDLKHRLLWREVYSPEEEGK